MKSIAKFSGLAAIIIATVVVIWCWILSPPTTAISDFGMQPPTDTIFNIGMVVSGLFTGIWAIYILRTNRFDLPKPLKALFVYSSFALTGVGLFPVVFDSWQRPTHWFFALSFFVGYMLLFLTYGVYQVRTKHKYGQLIFAVFSWLVTLVVIPFSRLWIEACVIATILIWILIISIRSLRDLR